MPEGQISLKGAIEPGVLAEVLQFICGRHDRAGYLRVSNQHVSGRIWCREGSIMAAECGGSRDIPAIRRILCMKSGEFAFVDTTTQTERTLFDDVTTILLESFRQIDETQEIEPLEPEPVADATIHRPAAPWAQQGGGSAPQPAATPAAAPAAGPAGDSPHRAPATTFAPRPALSAAYTTANRPAPPPHRRFPSRAARYLLLTTVVIALLGAGAWFWFTRRPTATEEHPATTAVVSFSQRLTARWQAWFPARPTTPPVAPEAEPEPVTWPALRLSGIVDVPGQKASAIINGRMVMEDDLVEGVRIEMVTRTGIVLRSGIHTRFVSETTIGEVQETIAPTNTPVVATNTFQRYYSGSWQWVKRLFGQ